MAAAACAAVAGAVAAGARLALLGVLATLLCAQALGQERSVFTDPEDGAFDASEWLLEKKGFLPVPMIITEPAIGYGAGAALLWFRESLGERRAQGRLTPPDIFGGAFAATENGTTLIGALGMVTFAEEKWRWRGFIGRPDVNLDFFGGPNDELKIGYNLKGYATTHLLQRRLGESENFVGARWNYIDFDVTFDPARPEGELPTVQRNIRSSGVGVFFEHDSRDNFFTPSRGWKLFVESVFYAEDLGSNGDYQLYRAYGLGYLPLAKTWILGLRADARAARGEVPFYQLPFIEMRGIPFFRYQDENVALAEAELRWNVTPRWALVGFLGSGRTWDRDGSFGNGESASAWGVGFRRLMARRLGIYMGLDIARGPEETAIYIQAGSAWR
jgi:hypothetical protein